MLKSLLFLLRFFAFWLLFFFIDRVIFLCYFTNKLVGVRFIEILRSLVYGLWMDISMAAYVSAVPLLIFIFLWIFPSIHFSPKAATYYNRFWVVIFSFITIVNFNIYREWGTKINYRALEFAFLTPQEAVASSSSSPVFSSFLIFFILLGIAFVLEHFIVDHHIPRKRPKLVWRLVYSVFYIAVAFLAIRGGWQLSPMNESMAYFSDKIFLNHAAINTEWTLIHDVISNKYGRKNPYQYMKTDVAEKLIADLYAKPVELSPEILTTKKPNVIIIMMESFTADLVESLGGEKGITPQFELLKKRGVLFTNIYASGDRTDKGLVAVLSAFPSQATRSIIHFNSKQEKLPSIAQEMAKNGYSTSFYYGGESEFFNIKSYFLSHAYKKLIDKHDFSSKDMNSKWGAYDHVVYKRQLADLKTEKQPFFSTLLTLTNHEPFELPVKPHFPGESLENKFRSTAYYADSCLADYLHQAESQAWFKNTVFVIVADHGHRLPKSKYENYDPHRYHIPLLIYGGAIKTQFQGKEIDPIGSQTDIAATLLTQLGMSTEKFSWSKDLLNPKVKPFAFYNWDNGFGFVTPQQTISFDNVGKTVIYMQNKAISASNASVLSNGKAFMQTVFQQYLDY